MNGFGAALKKSISPIRVAGLTPDFDSWLQLSAKADSGKQLVVSEVVTFLAPIWEIWMMFLALSSGLGKSCLHPTNLPKKLVTKLCLFIPTIYKHSFCTLLLNTILYYTHILYYTIHYINSFYFIYYIYLLIYGIYYAISLLFAQISIIFIV